MKCAVFFFSTPNFFGKKKYARYILDHHFYKKSDNTVYIFNFSKLKINCNKFRSFWHFCQNFWNFRIFGLYFFFPDVEKKNTANLQKEWVSGVSNFSAEKKYDTFIGIIIFFFICSPKRSCLWSPSANLKQMPIIFQNKLNKLLLLETSTF